MNALQDIILIKEYDLIRDLCDAGNYSAFNLKGGSPFFTINDFSDDFKKFYSMKEMYDRDPYIRWAMKNHGTKIVSDLIKAQQDEKDLQFIKDLEKRDIHHVLVVSRKNPDYSKSYGVFCRTKSAGEFTRGDVSDIGAYFLKQQVKISRINNALDEMSDEHLQDCYAYIKTGNFSKAALMRNDNSVKLSKRLNDLRMKLNLQTMEQLIMLITLKAMR